MKDHTGMSIAERFVNAARTFVDDEVLLADLCFVYQENLSGLIWNPDGLREHILIFDDNSGVFFSVDGEMVAGKLQSIGIDVKDSPELSLAHQHLRKIDATRVSTQERKDAVDAMHRDIIKKLGSLDKGTLYLMKDMSSLAVIRANGSISATANTPVETLRSVSEALASMVDS